MLPQEIIRKKRNKQILSPEDIVITDGNNAVGLAGVMGGLSTEIEENTKKILNNTKATSKNQARSINNMISENNNDCI